MEQQIESGTKTRLLGERKRGSSRNNDVWLVGKTCRQYNRPHCTQLPVHIAHIEYPYRLLPNRSEIIVATTWLTGDSVWRAEGRADGRWTSLRMDAQRDERTAHAPLCGWTLRATSVRPWTSGRTLRQQHTLHSSLFTTWYVRPMWCADFSDVWPIAFEVDMTRGRTGTSRKITKDISILVGYWSQCLR